MSAKSIPSTLSRLWNSRPAFMRRPIDSIVFAPPGSSGGVKSLYNVCSWLNRLGRCAISPFDGRHLVSWFPHDCRIYDESYFPDLVIYPEIHQPDLGRQHFHICFALGRYQLVQPHADLVVVKSPDMMDWVRRQNPRLPTRLIRATIQRSVFEYDQRPKQDIIAYMTRPHKHPETAVVLRDRYGDRVVEIVNQTEAGVAEILKTAKVFVWRGAETEASPRPPKEALVAGCVVVGLASELAEKHGLNFGVKCADVDELIHRAGEALQMPMPTPAERAVVRDGATEAQEWLAMIRALTLNRRR